MGRVSAEWDTFIDTFIETAPFCQEALIVCRSHRLLNIRRDARDTVIRRDRGEIVDSTISAFAVPGEIEARSRFSVTVAGGRSVSTRVSTRNPADARRA